MGKLGIDVSLIRIKHVNNLTSPNGATTGGSAGSETNQVAAIHCCDILNERLQPIKDELGPGATWQEIISAANDKYIDLCARYMFEANKNNYLGYNVWGVNVIEVEVDILTGEMYTVRADVLQDAGLSGWWQLHGPATVEQINLHTGVNPDQFTF